MAELNLAPHIDLQRLKSHIEKNFPDGIKRAQETGPIFFDHINLMVRPKESEPAVSERTLNPCCWTMSNGTPIEGDPMKLVHYMGTAEAEGHYSHTLCGVSTKGMTGASLTHQGREDKDNRYYHPPTCGACIHEHKLGAATVKW